MKTDLHRYLSDTEKFVPELMPRVATGIIMNASLHTDRIDLRL